jgi:bifunctional UDP-N-acetylglucosamine pyrophosphorylase / glucosamine-1-phosphate N-acetyltransferase
MKVSTIILAAGQGTRMVSNLPKVLHPINGKPMILYCVEAALTIGSEKPVVVTGNGAEEVKKTIGDRVEFVHQEKRLGTAHAVMAAESALKRVEGLILIIAGDMPLITPDTLNRLVHSQELNPGPLTISIIHSNNPRGFGRILRSTEGKILGIVEEAQATPAELAVDELNVGAYCVSSDWLWRALSKIDLSPKGEYYLTDLVKVAVKEGVQVKSIELSNQEEAMGINSRVHLSEAERIIRRRVNEKHMLAGVTMIDPALVYIEDEVRIAKDTTLYPNTRLTGRTVIGEHCEIGPDTNISNSHIGSHCHILSSLIEGADVEDGVGIGPYCHLRKGARLGKGVHLGNFGEVKDSTLAAGVKMGHFSYIGNAIIGENVNIGAGTITCNFDGVNKNLTEIGEGTFIGSDTMLVAPVKIGKGAKTGAGSVVTHDVADGELVVGVPAKPLKRNK